MISEVLSSCVLTFDCSMSLHGAESTSSAAAIRLGSRPHLRNSGEKSADAIWWLAGGWWELRLARCGHLGPWLNYWLGNVSGEIYIDHPGATSGTAVGGSCYQARKARQTGSSDDKSSSLWNQLPIAFDRAPDDVREFMQKARFPTWSFSSEREGEFSSQASNDL